MKQILKNVLLILSVWTKANHGVGDVILYIPIGSGQLS